MFRIGAERTICSINDRLTSSYRLLWDCYFKQKYCASREGSRMVLYFLTTSKYCNKNKKNIFHRGGGRNFDFEPPRAPRVFSNIFLKAV